MHLICNFWRAIDFQLHFQYLRFRCLTLVTQAGSFRLVNQKTDIYIYDEYIPFPYLYQVRHTVLQVQVGRIPHSGDPTKRVICTSSWRKGGHYMTRERREQCITNMTLACQQIKSSNAHDRRPRGHPLWTTTDRASVNGFSIAVGGLFIYVYFFGPWNRDTRHLSSPTRFSLDHGLTTKCDKCTPTNW